MRKTAARLACPYQILGLEKGPTYDQSDLKRKYRVLAMQKHPDRGGDGKDFLQLQDAYKALRDGRPMPSESSSTRAPSPDWGIRQEKASQIDMTILPEAMFLYRNMVVHLTPPASFVQAGMVLYSTRGAGPRFKETVIIIAEASDRGGVIAYAMNRAQWGGPCGHRGHVVLVHEHSKTTASYTTTREACGFFFDVEVTSDKVARHPGSRLLNGYCGWAPGVLDSAVKKGKWKLLASSSVVWLHNTPPTELYHAAVGMPAYKI
eukprot:TRINITY_DN6997_c4_g1_i1.p1 TRINITY_DN6997_c4_g1~~TRINITY_DN6997_c4_g1_i1.p1  ORF type:complete len:262 (+),score=44.66 TRINITY_DN6997_c4_g1_i1:67-852(+)